MDYSKSMARRRDEELLRIAFPDSDAGYVAEATEAARAELERRGVNAEAMTDVIGEIREERAAFKGRDSEPLSNRGWLGFLLFGWALIVTIPAVILLGAQGYRQKVRDATGAIIWSFLLGLVLIALVIGLTILTEFLPGNR